MENFAVAVDWSEATGAPITHVNQFVAQPGPPTLEAGPDGIYLLLGSIPPPFIPRDIEGQRRAIETLKATGLKVNVHGRFHMSRARLEELIQVLQTTADTYDAMVEQITQHRSEAMEG
ncbi:MULTISPECIES: hypothetical protein [Sphaerimonospora]|uniref:Uncharacterized protein n=2 Tax=Sphaerimonospora TaxID=1792303 RepID=A0A8J3RDB8_9ACTN|nr:hypothetical protein [Sphaerimonospora thailandensis]GIH72674.1 hypothetical protein Mth01_49270 [Sphaerimonospora thailandensis]